VITVEVEQWLGTLDLAPSTKSKIRTIMSGVFDGKRYGMILLNPYKASGALPKRLKQPEALRPQEFACLLSKFPQRERRMVFLAGTTGLRRPKLIALT
jgi:hypothetical protein